ncbi:MAG TPA: DUF364 domain-containing protein [bacterium]|nr:DUF364 domain-containing protein [bacterium]
MLILENLIKNINLENRPLKKVSIGLYSVYVENSDAAGLSSTLYFSENKNNCSHKHYYIKDAGLLQNLSGKEICERVFSDMTLEASVGMAAINSFINADLNTSECLKLNAFDLIAERSAGKTVGVIGHYPFMEKLKKIAAKLFVFDNSPKEDGDMHSSDIVNYLPECDTVAITGTSMFNGTVESILKNVKKEAYKIMLGPSTPMSKIMFDFGFDALCGTIVVDKEKTLNYISQAVSFKQIKGVEHLILKK